MELFHYSVDVLFLCRLDAIFSSRRQATKETGIQYTFAEQETSQGVPFDCLEESYNYLKAHGSN